MILRIMIGLGLLLMLVGFGAAGWQYWQSLPATVAAASPASAAASAPVPEAKRWLIASDGSLVPQTDVRAFLVQDRFVSSRTVEVIRRASLDDLLDQGEKLPVAAYHEVLADIRAPRVADGLCDVLNKSFAPYCALNAARVVKGSIDQTSGTAMFRLELVYRVKDDTTELPDLASRVLRTDMLQLDLDAGAPGSESAAAALSAAASAVGEACADAATRPFCRPMRFWVDWEPGLPVSIRAEIGWLDPLPEGMSVAPPLEPASGG